MALANLEKDLDSIITAIRRPEGGDTSDAVSYTHLTLPTILRV
jgi:hypothetical protein